MKIKALAACNGGGKKMTIDKEYDVPDRDARYLIATGKAELVEAKAKKSEPEKKETAKKPAPKKTAVDSKSGLKG